MTESKKHGGARVGAGRKTKYESTSTMRVPDAYKTAIKALINHLDETAHITSDYTPAESEPVFFRSLDLRAQEIIFKVSGK